VSGLVQAFSSWVIPALLLLVPGVALLRGVRVYEVFCEGAREGLETAFRILPYLVAMFVAVGVFRASHGLDAVLGLLRPAAERLGLPAEVLPRGDPAPALGLGLPGSLG